MEFIADHHRHSKPLKRHRFSIGAVDRGALVGVLTVDVPSSGLNKYRNIVEIRRVCVLEGHKNVASFLIGHACNACFSMGYDTIMSYTQPEESGSSLLACGFEVDKRDKIVLRKDNSLRGGLVTWCKIKDQPFSERRRDSSREILQGTHALLEEWDELYGYKQGGK